MGGSSCETAGLPTPLISADTTEQRAVTAGKEPQGCAHVYVCVYVFWMEGCT